MFGSLMMHTVFYQMNNTLIVTKHHNRTNKRTQLTNKCIESNSLFNCLHNCHVFGFGTWECNSWLKLRLSTNYTLTKGKDVPRQRPLIKISIPISDTREIPTYHINDLSNVGSGTHHQVHSPYSFFHHQMLDSKWPKA
jgi:hypothetical protein